LRGQHVEAANAFWACTLKPLAELLRMRYCPVRWDFGVRYLDRDLPPTVYAQFRDVAWVRELGDLEEHLANATAWGMALLRELNPDARQHVDGTPAPINLRHATLDDVPAIQALIAASARALGAGDYTAEQIEAALLGAWGVDSEIIRDRTYFVGDAAGSLVCCGGWSRRATSFGGDAYHHRESRALDPRTEAARIRAFFVHPQWARQGLGSRLLARCEQEAAAAGFLATELVATLPGERLYVRHGYAAAQRSAYPLPGGVTIEFVAMRKTL
jgi:GNAT superfamily N-acetyltransferase